MSNNQVWLITGASSGIGLELAKAVAAKGDRVIAASRKPEKIDDLKLHENVKSAHLDPNESFSEIESSIAQILSIYGSVDVVVNNAAYVQTGTLEETTPEETLQQFQTNLFGPLNIYRAILPHLREKKSGTLVSIGSMAAWYPMAGFNLYDASKAALRILTIGLGAEVAQFGIRHMLVEPGFFRTELLNPSGNIGAAASKQLDVYADINATVKTNLGVFHGSQLGDPVKGVEILYDVITSTGVSAGKELPEFLPLGSDACDGISQSLKQTQAIIDEWRPIASMSDFPAEK